MDDTVSVAREALAELPEKVQSGSVLLIRQEVWQNAQTHLRFQPVEALVVGAQAYSA